MILYIVRHAIAVDKTEWNGDDSRRPLTKEGVQKMRKVADGLKGLGLSFDRILTSPHRRAYDTAMIIAERFKARKKIKIVKHLASDADPMKLVRHLALDYLSGETLVLVGHEPYLSQLISVLIGADKPLALNFKKGGICKLSADTLHYGKCATLDWFIPPKILKRL